MICADKKDKQKRSEKPIRIAILDSGVDLNTDMNIAETISLVPGEGDMNPLFMDASGHGTSVAGLAAASLAAPQAAGAAARILEKDRDVSPDFVRDLLCASANSYGSPEEYGNGLIDLEYALKQYGSFKKNYKKGITGENIHNKKPVTVFEDTGCVKGCWATKDHEKMIKDDDKKYLKDLKMGARFPDSQGGYYEAGRIKENGNWKTLYLFRGMKHNPWWHGYYKRSLVKKFPCNYVFAYIFETQLANEMKTPKAVAMPKNSALATVARYIKDSIGRIDWKRHYHDTVPTRDQKRAFMWGMAMHSLADAFAHSTCYKNGIRITHDDDAADNTNDYRDQRWKHAIKAVNAAIQRYHQGTEKNPSPGTYKEFSAVRDATKYRMINIKQYITEVSNALEGKKYQNVSISKK